MKNKIYLGDSVYCGFTGHDFILTTENGFGPSNTIYLEPQLVEILYDFYKRHMNIGEEKNGYGIKERDYWRNK